jgi:ATP-binding cassette subfamily A (ABC1) protein 3
LPDSNPLSRLYKRVSRDRKQQLIRAEEAKNDDHFKDTQVLERAEAGLEIGIEIKRLHKVYSRGNNHALKGLELNFYKNEITALLGHNGAGKSTTMHLLTGLYKPTAGTALIDGHSIRSGMDQIRRSVDL